MTLPEAQRVTGHDGYDSISISTGGEDPDTVKAAVTQELGRDFLVRTGKEAAEQQAQDLSDALGFIRIALLIFAGVALLVGGFLIFNTFTVTVAQRTKEFALLRVLGASRRQILHSVLIETFAIGLLASILGVLAGLRRGARARRPDAGGRHRPRHDRDRRLPDDGDHRPRHRPGGHDGLGLRARAAGDAGGAGHGHARRRHAGPEAHGHDPDRRLRPAGRRRPGGAVHRPVRRAGLQQRGRFADRPRRRADDVRVRVPRAAARAALGAGARGADGALPGPHGRARA